MVILRGKLENYKPPLSCPKNMPHDFLTYGLFLRRGEREPNEYSNIPPCQSLEKTIDISYKQ